MKPFMELKIILMFIIRIISVLLRAGSEINPKIMLKLLTSVKKNFFL